MDKLRSKDRVVFVNITENWKAPNIGKTHQLKVLTHSTDRGLRQKYWMGWGTRNDTFVGLGVSDFEVSEGDFQRLRGKRFYGRKEKVEELLVNVIILGKGRVFVRLIQV